MAYRNILSRLPNRTRFVEVGTYCGRSLCSVAQVIKPHDVKFIAVDPFVGFHLHDSAFLQEWENNIRAAGLCGYEWGHIFSAVFNDYDSVKADIEAWRPMVCLGGYLMGHDYGIGDGHPGVRQAVHEIFGGPQALVSFPSGHVWAMKR